MDYYLMGGFAVGFSLCIVYSMVCSGRRQPKLAAIVEIIASSTGAFFSVKNAMLVVNGEFAKMIKWEFQGDVTELSVTLVIGCAAMLWIAVIKIYEQFEPLLDNANGVD